jgi:hypothetical protein
MTDYKLCYVRGDNAYFTTASLEEQWGDDWDDAPYEHNAGRPYEYEDYRDCEPYEILHLKFELAFSQEPWSGYNNSPYAVEDINNGDTFWLSVYNEPDELYANASPSEFIDFVRRHDGMVFKPMPSPDQIKDKFDSLVSEIEGELNQHINESNSEQTEPPTVD